MEREKIVMGWSGGKDSSLALREIRRQGLYEVVALITTCTEGYDRISMHGVRCALLERQAEELGLPLRKVFISQGATNEEYEARTNEAFLSYKAEGITKVAFGDLYLEDIRAYRDRMMTALGMSAIYPVWGLDTRALAREFVRDGFRAVLVCIDPRAIDKSFAGRIFDDALIDDLPANVDPCGENGEFHTFVYEGPIFRRSIPCVPGEVVYRQNFYFADLVPAVEAGASP
jgi:uncharacterized protein (TIGR00290 family)